MLFASGPTRSMLSQDNGNAPAVGMPLTAALETGDAVQRGRNADRTAGIGADGDLAELVADSSTGARR